MSRTEGSMRWKRLSEQSMYTHSHRSSGSGSSSSSFRPDMGSV